MLKTVRAFVKPVQKLKSWSKKRKGKEKTFSLDANGQVQESEADNAFLKERAKDALEAAIWASAKVPAALGKGTGSVLGTDVVGALPIADPISQGSKAYKGVLKAAQNTKRGVELTGRKNKARDEQKAAEERGDSLHLGLGNIKRAVGTARNDAVADAAQGVLQAGAGGTGVGAFFDPTGTTAAVSGALGTANKTVKKGLLLHRAIRKGLRQEKLAEKRELARQGDAEAIEWVMDHDTRYASAQLLMHAQDDAYYSDDEREAAKGAAQNVLGLGDDVREHAEQTSLGEHGVE